MPVYTYEHPTTKEQVDVVQRMTEPHVHFVDGIEWARVFGVPSAKIDSLENLDPFDRRGFVARTARKGMTVGDMWDESKRLSDKRAKKTGKDEVKAKAEKDYTHRTGKAHPLADKTKPKFHK